MENREEGENEDVGEARSPQPTEIDSNGETATMEVDSVAQVPDSVNPEPGMTIRLEANGETAKVLERVGLPTDGRWSVEMLSNGTRRDRVLEGRGADKWSVVLDAQVRPSCSHS